MLSPRAREDESTVLHSPRGLLICACMNASKKPNRLSETAAISPEALIGLGITIGALGLLGLMLGWAEQMRSVPKVAILWFGLGAAFVVLGGIIAALARIRKGR